MAIRINRVYTGVGDRGETQLVGGRFVAKDSPRIHAYGTIDELNAALGLARVWNAERCALPASAAGPGSAGASAPRPTAPRLTAAMRKKHEWLDALFRRLQNELFDLGSELATPEDAVYEGMHRVSEADVRELERTIDECQRDLEPLSSFVLPGGGRISGFLHLARTICRRAERDVLGLSRVEPVSAPLVVYVNRLSDLLFVLSRWVGKHLGETEYLWERGLASHARGRRRRSRAAAPR